MAFDAFLWFGPSSHPYFPPGETQDKSFKSVKAFEIKSFSFGAKNKATVGSQSGGAGAGRAELNEFKVAKLTDNGSPKLFGACVAGAHFDNAYLAIRKSGGQQTTYPAVNSPNDAQAQCYLLYTFSLVYVSEITWQGSSGDDVPTEDVTFAYGALKITYRIQDQKGALGATSEQPWSQVLNQPTEATM